LSASDLVLILVYKNTKQRKKPTSLHFQKVYMLDIVDIFVDFCPLLFEFLGFLAILLLKYTILQLKLI